MLRPGMYPWLFVLHVRQSGLDMKRYGSWCFGTRDPIEEQSDKIFDLMTPVFRDLACWAFEPSGIASLRMLAFGDFSSRGRFSSRNLILTRKDAPVADGDLPRHFLNPRLEHWKWLGDTVIEFLEACPSEPLMYVGDCDDDVNDDEDDYDSDSDSQMDYY
ncbi:hypothetical protein F4678DRAFT_274935 [Xylaria arbuscula]|nr:hypothetical protein F4678DRAFT_274935 [Xylaria arbuscula]